MIDVVSLSVFYEVAALLVLAAAIGLVGVLLRQPLIVSFIAVGVLAGPGVLGIARSAEHITLLAELGISVLLFLVGLKLDLNLVRTLGAVSVATGLGQVVFTSVIGFGLGLALGLDPLTSLYVAVALTFSSTIIIVKLLSDKREIDSLHGRIALGFLIVQDLVVVFAMIVLSAVGVGIEIDTGVGDLVRIAGSGVAFLVAVGLFVRFAADPLVERLARAPELLVCFAIGWAALFAAIGDLLGFSKELGGLLAGVSLASTRYREAMAARLAPLRDFLLLFFFLALGARLDLSLIGEQVPTALVLSIFVLVGNPLIVVAIMGAMGYRKRTSFLAGLTVAQISEFSLIFIALGVSLDHLDSGVLGLTTLVGLITIGLSTYMITYSHRLYAWLEPLLGPFERHGAPREAAQTTAAVTKGYDAVVVGLGRFGGAIAQRLLARGQRVLGIDFNPSAVRQWSDAGLDVVYGDATDPEFVAGLPLGGVRWVVSAMPVASAGIGSDDPRTALIRAVRSQGRTCRVAVVLQRESEREALVASGADIFLHPFEDAADQAVDLVIGRDRPARIEAVEVEGQRDLAP